MPSRFATILRRLQQDLTADLGPQAITDACKLLRAWNETRDN